MPRSLTWLTAGFLAVSAIIAIIGAGAYVSLAGIIEDREIARLEAVADLKAARVESWLQERRGDARVIAEGPNFREAFGDLRKGKTTTQSVQRLVARLNLVREAFGYASIELFDASGKGLFASGELLHEGLRGKHGDALEKTLASPHAELIDFHYHNIGKQGISLSVAIAIRPDDQAQQPAAGVLLLNIDPDRFLFPVIQNWPGPSRTGEALLVRREGDEVVFINRLRHSTAPPLSLRQPMTNRELPAVRALEGATGRINGLDYRGVPVTAAVRQVATSPWSLVVKVDDDEIFHDVKTLASVTIAAVAFVIVGAAIFVILLWRQQRMTDVLAIAEKDSLFRSVVDHAADAVLIATPDGSYIYANKEATKLFGYSHAELLTMQVGDITAPAARANTLARFGDLKQRGYVRFEIALMHKDGRLLPVDINAVALPDDRLFLSFRDIADHKALERRLREERDFGDAVLQATGTVIVVLDQRGRIVRFNQAAESITGFGMDELRGHP